MHVMGDGSLNKPDMNSNTANDGKSSDSKKGRDDATMTHAKKKLPSVDNKGDDFVLRSSSTTTENAETIHASKQHQVRKNADMDHRHNDGHQEGLPSLWPMMPAGPPSVLSLAAHRSVAESMNSAIQRNNDILETEPERRRTVQNHNDQGRQPISDRHVLNDHQETNHQACNTCILNSQAAHSAQPYANPAIYHPQRAVDMNRQAARHQHHSTDSHPKIRQAPQHTATHQQAVRQVQPTIYLPQPAGIKVNQQATRHQPTFVDHGPHYHQAPRTDQASISRQLAPHPGPRPAQASFHVSERDARTGAPVGLLEAARNPQASNLDQQAQLQAWVNAKMAEARNRYGLSAHQSETLASLSRQDFISNQLSSSAAGYGYSLGVGEQQRAYPAQHQANHPPPGFAQASLSHGFATSSSHLPVQPLPSQQHASSPLASRQAPRLTVTDNRPNVPSVDPQVLEVCLPLFIDQRKFTDVCLSIHQKSSKQPMPFSSVLKLTEIWEIGSVPSKMRRTIHIYPV